MYLTTTGVVVATLTRLGRQLLADNSQNFKITKFRLSDDEIDYSLFQNAVDDPNVDIENLPILEGCTLGNKSSQRYEIMNLPFGTLQVAKIDANLSQVVEGGTNTTFIDGRQNDLPDRDSVTILYDSNFWSGNTFNFMVKTFYGNDPSYLIRSLNSTIANPSSNIVNSTADPDPYEIQQRQTVANIGIVITVSPNVNTSWSTLTQGQYNKIVSFLQFVFPGRPVPGYSVFSTQPGSFLYSQLGYASTRIEITGSNTGKKFYLDVVTIIPHIIQANFENLAR